MVGKRGLYLNILSIAVLLGALVFLNTAVLHHAIPNGVYRFLSIAVPTDDIDQPVISRLAADETLERENAVLRKQLGVPARLARTLKIARIISIERTVFVSTLIIDQGIGDGIQKDLTVLGAGNILVGKIDEVFEHSSRVVLVDDPRLIISTRFQGTSLLAESRGNSHDTIDVNLISHTDQVSTQSILVTSGLDMFPEGLAVAEITKIEPGDSSLFQKITGRTLFNFHESPLLFIVI